MTEPIDKVCTNPRRTRQAADAGEPTPCYRCLAFRPDTPTGCHFLERPPVNRTSPRRRPSADQPKLW